MAPEAHLRRNRLALIASVLSDFSRIADFSEIVPGSGTTCVQFSNRTKTDMLIEC
jgi:hypothetical protein